MNLLLLGGNNQHNKAWAYKVQETVEPLFSECRVHEYAHWENGASFIDFDHELHTLPETVAGLSPYIVFAKSVGVVLAIHAISEKVLAPVACFFVGFPLELVQKNEPEFSVWLSKVEVPMLIAQNVADPAGSAVAVRDFLFGQEMHDVELHKLAGTTHEYTEFSALKRFFVQLLGPR